MLSNALLLHLVSHGMHAWLSSCCLWILNFPTCDIHKCQLCKVLQSALQYAFSKRDLVHCHPLLVVTCHASGVISKASLIQCHHHLLVLCTIGMPFT